MKGCNHCRRQHGQPSYLCIQGMPGRIDGIYKLPSVAAMAMVTRANGV